LRGREKNVLKVVGLDAIDGSPVVDIKPYIDEFYPQGRVAVADWMTRLQTELEEGRQ
jgi:tRNA (Thr-GGU) A37 N-methylase